MPRKKTPPAPGGDMISQSEAARRLGLSPTTIGLWRADGRIRGGLRINGRLTLVPAQEIERIRPLLGTPDYPDGRGRPRKRRE